VADAPGEHEEQDINADPDASPLRSVGASGALGVAQCVPDAEQGQHGAAGAHPGHATPPAGRPWFAVAAELAALVADHPNSAASLLTMAGGGREAEV